MLYVHKCPDTGRVFICRKGEDGNLAEVFPHNGRSAEQVARRVLGNTFKPTVLVTITYGNADFQVFPNKGDAAVEVIDFDNFAAEDNPNAIKACMSRVKKIPVRYKAGRAYKHRTLGALEDQLEICKENMNHVKK